jgi:hypothetical protein
MDFLNYMSSPPGRAIRVTAGLLMILAGAAAGGGWRALAAAGLLPLATGVLGVCPVSPLFGKPWRARACRARN